MIIKNWQTPPAYLRSKLFWAWNGDTDAGILAEQIASMQAMGLGGFYIHSRNGLKTAYLGDKWFDMVRFALDEAEKAGISGCLYDEDRWPSGAAGGKVSAADPALAASTLHYQTGGDAPENTIASVEYNGVIHHFYVKKHAPSEWFNGSTYPDVFNPASAELFLQLTHEKYLAECKNLSTSPKREIFMDEPFYGIECFRFGQTLPWTPKLPELYLSSFGESILPQLPGLFNDLPDNSHIRTRWQFHTLIARLFRENFLRPIARWCEKHNFTLTGHLLGEDMISSQIGSHGSNMAALQFFHQPGIDYLTAQRRHPATVKQLSSAAHQLGRNGRLAEIYGCTGWEFSLFDQRRQGDMLFALGVNRHCLHLGWYSAEGERKRDFPGSLAWHAAGSAEYSRLEERFARLHAIFEQCSEIRHILLLDPVESGYTLMQENYENCFAFDPLENSRTMLIDTLLNANLDFDFGDEELLAVYGRTDGKNLLVGKGEYQAVILPETVTLRHTTVELLEKFAAGGGKIFIAGTPPKYIDGKAAEKTVPGKVIAPRELPDELKFCRALSIHDGQHNELPGVIHLLMRHEKGFFLFIHNPGYTIAQQADATNWRGAAPHDRAHHLPEIYCELKTPAAQVQFWNADDGSVTAGSVPFSLAAGESKLLFFADEAENLPGEAVYTPVKPENQRFPIRLTEPNVMLFDRAEAGDENGYFHAPADMLRLNEMFRKRYGLPTGLFPRRQPWAEADEGKTFPVTLRFTFFCDSLPQDVIRFAAEDRNAEIFCNGQRLERCDFFWFDHSLHFFEVKNLCRGINHIIMRTGINRRRSLENCFLLGDFGVKISGFDLHLTDPVRFLEYGSWVEQGLPFYSGAVDYQLILPPGRGRKLDLKFKAACAAVMEADDRFWHEAEKMVIPDGINKATLRIYGSRRNSHGPFHVVQQLRYCNPASFIPLREEFHPFWQLEEYGIFTRQEN